MPAEKSSRVQNRRRIINRNSRSRQRTIVRKAQRMLVGGNDEAETKAAVTSAVSALDRAARKRVIHPNNAARQKSKLTTKLTKLFASSDSPAETPSAPTRQSGRTKKAKPA